MSQQIKVTRELDATGATLIGLGTPWLGAGRVYYVDYTSTIGNDANEGTNPNYPLLKIQTALNKLRNNKNDYVFILASKDADAAAAVDFPEPGYRMHLVGISNPQATFGVVMRVTGETISAMSLTACAYSEIAGISFGGGATEKGGIQLGQIAGLWIHNCVFGHSFCGDTPWYGVHGGPNNAENTMVENCFFYGTGDNAKGKIGGDGIYLMDVGACARNFIIRNNVFVGIPGIAVNVTMEGGMIMNNSFKLDADTAGAAITLGTHSHGCWIDGNSANFGGTDAMTAEAYVDDSSEGADANTWGLNYTGGALDFPA